MKFLIVGHVIDENDKFVRNFFESKEAVSLTNLAVQLDLLRYEKDGRFKKVIQIIPDFK